MSHLLGDQPIRALAGEAGFLLGWNAFQLEQRFLPSHPRLEFAFHHVIEVGHCLLAELKWGIPR